MKILAINGSHRGRNGYTQFLINKVLEGAASQGAEVETVTLTEHTIQRCTGCFTCQKQARLGKCIYDGKDAAAMIYNKMREADLLIFATPVYVFNLSSALKNLFDRYPSTSDCNNFNVTKSHLYFHNIDPRLCSKPFATIICQDNLEKETHKNILSYFKTYSRFMDASYVGSLVRRSAAAAGHGRNDDKLKVYPELDGIYKAFVQAGKELATKGRIAGSTQRKANQKLIRIPFFVRYLANFGPVKKVFKEKVEAIHHGA